MDFYASVKMSSQSRHQVCTLQQFTLLTSRPYTPKSSPKQYGVFKIIRWHRLLRSIVWDRKSRDCNWKKRSFWSGIYCLSCFSAWCLFKTDITNANCLLYIIDISKLYCLLSSAYSIASQKALLKQLPFWLMGQPVLWIDLLTLWKDIVTSIPKSAPCHSESWLHIFVYHGADRLPTLLTRNNQGDHMACFGFSFWFMANHYTVVISHKIQRTIKYSFFRISHTQPK